MQFAQPLWILAGILTCAVFAMVLHIFHKRRLATLKQFASAQLLGRLTRHISPEKRKLKHLLLVLAVFLMFVALARPQYGFRWVEVKRKGIDILFALDTSKSMLAEDTRPNRLQRAKLGILDFVNQLQGDRIGLMPFAGSSYLMCPLTLDYDAFATSLNSVSTDIIPLGGTDISEVIRSAEQVLSNDSNHKVLVLITDGENLEGDVLETARKAKENGMTIYTVGVGTTEGELIPLPGPQAGFVKNSEGKFVTSRLDEKTLKEIAAVTGGIYAPLGSGGEGLEAIYQQKLKLIPKEELAERRHKVPMERFSWPLAAAIILLIIEYLTPERKGNGSLKLPAIKTVGRRAKKNQLAALIGAVLLSALYLRPICVSASEGEDAYARQDYLTASDYYSQALKAAPKDPVLNYNFGTSAYQNNLYEQAAASFTEALNSADLALQQKAYFNLGNTLFKLGEEKQQANPQAALKQWQEALESYDSALKLKANDQLAVDNRAYVEQKIEELKKQMEQQQNQQQKQDDQQQDKQQGSEGPKQDQAEQNSPSPPQQEQEGDNNQSANTQQPESQTPEKGDTEGKDSAETKRQDPAAQQPAGQSAKDQQAAQQRDQRRRELGKMTREEAENLLKELKGEESELNFVPAGKQGMDRNGSGRDW